MAKTIVEENLGSSGSVFKLFKDGEKCFLHQITATELKHYKVTGELPIF
ncbi:MAG: hypothetical protein KAX49_17725 [Halanaerobiales bacterium]|nr:hypothetical protein [Halanaerobiales bacterium]